MISCVRLHVNAEHRAGHQRMRVMLLREEDAAGKVCREMLMIVLSPETWECGKECFVDSIITNLVT